MQWQSQSSTPGLGWPTGMVQDIQPCINAFHWFKSYFPTVPVIKAQRVTGRNKQLLISIKKAQKCNEETPAGNIFSCIYIHSMSVIEKE